MYADVAPVESRSSKVRSRIDNDIFATPGLDGRSAEARRFKDILRGLIAELGGEQKLATTARLQVRNTALQAVRVEALQQQAMICDVDSLELTRQVNTLARMLRTLGLRKSETRQPSLAEVLEGKKR